MSNISFDFHNRHYDEMYDKQVQVILKSGDKLDGIFSDEFFDEDIILISGKELWFIKIEDIKSIGLV